MEREPAPVWQERSLGLLHAEPDRLPFGWQGLARNDVEDCGRSRKPNGLRAVRGGMQPDELAIGIQSIVQSTQICTPAARAMLASMPVAASWRPNRCSSTRSSS